MKKSVAIFSMICLTTVKLCFSQLNADAGPDKVVCVGFQQIDTIAIGGAPSAFGGTAPFTYAWEAEYIWDIGSQTFTFSASDYLNDTTLANPKIIYPIGENIEFRLIVTDAEGTTATDSTTVNFAYFTSHLGYTNYTIDQGDSIYLSGMENIFGGFPPYEYLWRPNHGLTDSTSLSFWAKPEYSVAYYMTLTDSAGCVVTGAPVYYVEVLSLQIEEANIENSMLEVYPNPVSNLLNINIHPSVQGEFTLRLYLGNGKLIKQQKFQENQFAINMEYYPSGIYIYELVSHKGFTEQGQIIVQ